MKRREAKSYSPEWTYPEGFATRSFLNLFIQLFQESSFVRAFSRRWGMLKQKAGEVFRFYKIGKCAR
jgi:hypothetical protein